MQTLVKGTFYRLLYMAFSFCTGLFISGLAGTALFGTLSLFTVNAALLILISGMGHDASLYWHRSSGKMDAARSVGYGWLISAFQLVLFLLGSLASLFFTDKLLLSRLDGGLFPLEAVYFIGLILTERYVTFFYSSGKAALCNKILTLASLSTLILPGIFYFLISCLLPDPFILFCLIPLLQGIILLIAFHRDDSYPGIAWPERAILSSIFKFSLLVFVTNLIQFFAYRIDYWLISFLPRKKSRLASMLRLPVLLSWYG